MYKTGYDLDDRLIAERYSAIPDMITMPRYFYPFVAEHVARLCPVGGRLLDIGCGNGYLLREIGRRRRDITLTGVDCSAGLAAHAASGNGAAALGLASANALPFTDRSFDLATMTEVVEHLKDPIQALREVARTVATGGVLLLTAPNMSAYSPWWRLAEHLPRGPWQRLFLPWEHPLKTFQPIDTAYLFDEILALVEEAGLRARRIHGREFFPYLTNGVPGMRRVYRQVGHQWLEPWVERLLPNRLAYRLLLECVPSPG